jgi:hypothetical protein
MRRHPLRAGTIALRTQRRETDGQPGEGSAAIWTDASDGHAQPMADLSVTWNRRLQKRMDDRALLVLQFLDGPMESGDLIARDHDVVDFWLTGVRLVLGHVPHECFVSPSADDR